jgi:hypothetical protein
MTAGLKCAGRDCPGPAPHAAAQPSMIEDRGLRGARVPEHVIDGENGVVPCRAPQARLFSQFPATRFPQRYLQTSVAATRETRGSFQKLDSSRYLRQAGSATTVGISRFGAAPLQVSRLLNESRLVLCESASSPRPQNVLGLSDKVG